MKKQKPETRYESLDVNDNTYSSYYRKRAKNMVNRIVRRIFKRKLINNLEEI